MMLLIEFCLTLCAVLAGFIFPAAGSRWFETLVLMVFMIGTLKLAAESVGSTPSRERHGYPHP
jgi:hypothetical protein